MIGIGRRRLVEQTVAALPLGALVLDARDRVVTCNPAGHRMGLVRGDDLAINELRDLAREARRTRAAQHAEVPVLSGWLPRDPTAVGARAVPLDDRGHVALIVEDLSEARRITDMRRDFIANVSHELKTPVGALSLLAEALLDGCDDPETVARFAARIQHEASRLTRLVQELIELSRLESAEPTVDSTVVGVAELISEAVEQTRSAATARHITVTATLPADDAPLRLLGNRRQLISALVNLIDNAVQYSSDGTEVQLSAQTRGASCEIAVRDHGVGIAEEDQDRIFERFYRADPARSAATGGTGLGLAIVKHVVVNHGGQVEVRSRPGRGSTFTLTLPVTAVDAEVVR